MPNSNKCKAITLTGKGCTNRSTIDGYCIKHWFNIIEEKKEESEIPI